MIKKPCFDFDLHVSDKVTIAECDGCPLKHDNAWENCSFGQRHPFYPRWQRMAGIPAAGPWNYNLDEAPGGSRLLLLLDCGGVWRDWTVGYRSDGSWWAWSPVGTRERELNSVIAWAIINTEGL